MKKSVFAAALSSVAVTALLSAGALADTNIGAVAAVNKDVDGTPPNNETRRLILGDGVVSDERIDSSPVGSGQFMFLDQTTLTIAKNSTIVLDKYVYDPASKTGEFAMSMTKGVLRFVGGRITKNTDAVVTTPTATIGIRGGMAIIVVEEDGTTRVMHIAGDYTRVTRANGEEIIISRSNGSVLVPAAGDADAASAQSSASGEAPAAGVEGVEGDGSGEIIYLGVADAEFVRQVSLELIGRGEAGERLKPQDPDVVVSGVPDANSQARGATDAEPISTKGEEPNRGADADEEEIRLRPRDEEITTVVALDNLPGGAAPGGDAPGGDAPDAGAPPTIDPLTFLPGVTGAATIASGGVPGLAGGPGQTFVFAQVFDGSRVGITAAGEVFSIPVATGFFDFDATTGASPVGGITGSGFHDPVGEFTYAVFQTPDGDAGAFLAGAASDALAGAEAGTRQAINYAISPDLLTGSAAPFTPETVAGFDSGSRELTLLSNAGGLVTGDDAKVVSAYLDINGAGPGQTSVLGALTGTVEADGNGAPSFATFFDGVANDGAGASTRIETPVQTVEDGSGGAAFGPNAQYFALANVGDPNANDLAPGLSFNEAGQATQFGSNNVAARGVTEIIDTPLTLGQDGGRPQIDGPNGNLQFDGPRSIIFDAVVAANSGGYAAISGRDLGNNETYVGRSFNSRGVQLGVDPATNSAVASVTVDNFFSDFDGEELDTPDIFELDAEFGGQGDRSAAIDNDRFALRQSSDVESRGNNVAGLPDGSLQGGQNGFSGVFVSAAMVGDGGVFPAGVTAQSDFLQWGWWAGEFRHDPDEIDNPQNEGIELSSDQRFHLGAWIAGDLTANIPQIGDATYSGFAVISAVDNGVNFVDGAGFELTYSFAGTASSGTATFTDVLGANPTVAVNAGGSFGNEYTGTAGIEVGGRNGLISVDGSFFGPGAEATGGALDIATNDGSLQATGVFAGDRQGDINLPVSQ